MKADFLDRQHRVESRQTAKFERWLRNGGLRKRGTSDLRYIKPPDDLIVMLSLLIMAESSAKASAPSSTTQPAAAALLRAILFALFATL
jgi:hypothetical protein